MSEELNTQSTESVVESIGNPEKQPDSPDNTPPKQPSDVPDAAPEETRQTKHFKIMREKAERAERERDELARRIQELEVSKQQPNTDDDLQIDNDSYVEGKVLKGVHKEMRRMQQELRQYQQQSTVTAAELRLKTEYPDFDSVVSKENIELLNDMHPEIANTIKSSNSDIYGKAVTAYTLIKKLGIVPEKNYEAEKRKIQENAGKPRPLASIQPQSGDTPLAKAGAFTYTITESEKKALFQEMVESRKRVG